MFIRASLEAGRVEATQTQGGHRIKLHANAALSLNRRHLLLARRTLEQGWSLTEAAEAGEVSERTASKWARRYRAEGDDGLLDRPSAPSAVCNRSSKERVQERSEGCASPGCRSQGC